MSEKDKASPRQRVSMEQRWDEARRDCAYERCNPSYAFHIAGCTRRNNRKVTIAPEQKIKVTNLNTGETSEAVTVKEAMNQHEKQAVHLEPVLPGIVTVKDVNDLTQEELDVVANAKTEGGVILVPQELTFPDQTYWDEFEKGEPGAREPQPHIEERGDRRHPVFVPDQTGPVRPWWKFWGRRG